MLKISYPDSIQTKVTSLRSIEGPIDPRLLIPITIDSVEQFKSFSEQLNALIGAISIWLTSKEFVSHIYYRGLNFLTK